MKQKAKAKKHPNKPQVGTLCTSMSVSAYVGVCLCECLCLCTPVFVIIIASDKSTYGM